MTIRWKVFALLLGGWTGCTSTGAVSPSPDALDARQFDAAVDAADAFEGIDVSERERDEEAPAAHCPKADYFVALTGGVTETLRHFCGSHSVYGQTNDIPAYYAQTVHSTSYFVYACSLHESGTVSDQFVLTTNRGVVDYTAGSTAVDSAVGGIKITFTRDDGVGGIVEGTFDGDATRHTLSSTEPVHVSGTFRVCHLEDSIRSE